MNSKKENLWSKVSTFLVFAGPATFSFLAVVIVPFLYGVYLTFTSWDGVSSNKPFVGLKNYAAVVADSSFWQSLGLTLLYVVVSVILVNVIGFLLALLVTGKIKGKNFFRAGFFTPNLIGGIILGYIWQFVFNKVIVYFGDALNVTVLQKSMLSGSASAFAALVLVTIWQFSGYMMLIYIAGLTGVSEDLKEAAKIDGCNESQTTRYIVLPLMRASFTICMFLSLTNGFKLFDQNLALTAGRPFQQLGNGETIKTTEMLALNIVNAFSSNGGGNRGVGQAKAVIFFVVVAAISIIQLQASRRKEVQQ